ncbi:GGDEF domain-containing protein [Planctomycetota bacterium]
MSIEIAEDLAIAKTSTAELEAANRSLQISARTDSLTGLPNRAALTAEANAIWECSRKNPIRHFSVIMVDIDHFKSCNDLHGHRVGDEVLIAVANGLSSVMRGTDFIARYGGEEFTILLTNAGANDATIAAERFRKAVEETSVECGGQQIRVTASFGGASSDRCPNAKSFTDIIDLADQSLYAAKKAGRNRVVFGDQVSLCSPETGSPETGSSATGSPATGSSDTNE